MTNRIRSLRATPRLIAGLVGVIVAVITLSGCVVVKNVTASQVDSIGNVRIVATVCVSNTPGTCPEVGNTTVHAGNNNQNVQLFVAYRVTAGATGPATLRFDGDPGTGPLFSPNASYTSELQRLAPAPAGQQWIGYTSTLFNYIAGASPTSGVITAEFALPKDPATGLFTGPFNHRIVVGTRAIDAMHPITAPVACGNAIDSFNSTGSDGQTLCIDSPSPATFATSVSQATRDLVARAGTPPTAAAGTVAAVPFSLQFVGASAGSLIFGLNATTTIPGATPVTSPGTLTPTANSTTQILVSVPVPAGTARGTYPVTFSATIGGQSRTAQSSITVGPPGGGTAGLPTLTGLSVTPRSIARFRGAVPAKLKVTLSEAGTLRVAVARAAVGRRNANGKCVAPNRTLIRNGAKRCTRFVAVTTITKANQGAGLRTVTFSGRGRTPGVYRLTVTVRTASGQVSLPKSTTVTVRS
jgi:hypothetical protein